MVRLVVNFIARGDFNDLAEIHDGDACAEVAHHGKVVRDEEVGEAKICLKTFEEVDDFALESTHRERRIGSSQTMNCGLRASALAIPILCLCPPLSS